jgi:ferrochelatase
MPEGSPLLVHSVALTERLRARLPGVPIELGMRYGRPSLTEALRRLRAQGCDRLVVAPLYPQYASSSTGSTLERVYAEAARLWNVPSLVALPAFYDAAPFLDAFAAVARPHIEGFRADHVVFSFHGLPERQVKRSDETGRHCLASPSCCDAIVDANRNCYRAQSFATARGLAARLGLAAGGWSVTFQSRLGRTPWIAPYTDIVLPQLAKNGVRRVAVMCPAFVADCLETLEEIGLRARADFRAAGGDDLLLVPSLNAEPVWVEALARLIAAAAPLPADRQLPGPIQ